MAFDITFLPDPQNRTNSDWVVFYKILLDAVSQGESISVNGRSVQLPSMKEVQEQLEKYTHLAANDVQASSSSVSRFAPIMLG